MSSLDQPTDGQMLDADPLSGSSKPGQGKQHEPRPKPVPRWVRETIALPLDRSRLMRAKAAFTTRRIPLYGLFHGRTPMLVAGSVRPRSGDLVLARVERIGQHRHLELPNGRRARLQVGDEILVTYADRYAPDQYEAEVPLDLGPTQLVASGGVAASVLSRRAGFGRATDILPIGLACDEHGSPFNVADFAIPRELPKVERPRALAVFGTSMNSGKTTTVKSMVIGLLGAGEVVGTAKVTGTGSGADYWVMVDAGAHRVLDFTDVGLASTYRIPSECVEAAFVFLMVHLTNAGCSAILIEVADGIYQPETARLLTSETFRAGIDGVIFAAADAVGAAGGTQRLDELGLPVVAASGLLTRSPLAHREATSACRVPVFSPTELSHPATARQVFYGTCGSSLVSGVAEDALLNVVADPTT